jgi:hypothetical protein
MVGEPQEWQEITSHGSYGSTCNNAKKSNNLLIYRNLFFCLAWPSKPGQQVFAVNRQVSTAHRRKTLRFFL